jgi:hypothetical protein
VSSQMTRQHFHGFFRFCLHNSQTFYCAMKAPFETQTMILKFWKTIQEIYGPLDVYFSPRFSPSKEHSQRFLLNISLKWFSEDEAKRYIRTDQKGALSLLRATVWQAGLDKWDVQDKATLNAAKMPEIKMDGAQFERAGATGFCFSAIQHYPFFLS